MKLRNATKEPSLMNGMDVFCVCVCVCVSVTNTTLRRHGKC